MARHNLDASRAEHDVTDHESGQGLAEYSLIIAFVALVAIAGLNILGRAIADSDGFKLFDLF